MPLKDFCFFFMAFIISFKFSILLNFIRLLIGYGLLYGITLYFVSIILKKDYFNSVTLDIEQKQYYLIYII